MSSEPVVIHARRYRRVLAEREISKRFKSKAFPDTSRLFGGEAILGCWTGQVSSATEALDLKLKVVNGKA